MKVRSVVIITMIIAFVLAIAAGSTMMWRLLLLLLVGIGLGYFWVSRMVAKLDGRLEKMTRYRRVGENYEGTFTIENKGPLPIFSLEATEIPALPGYSNSIKIALPSGSSHSWTVSCPCRRRGHYRVGQLLFKLYDPLNLFYVNCSLMKTESLYVLPPLIELPYFQVLPRPEPGVNMRRWFAGEPGHNASRVREYFSGDSLRHIHWHSTAHTGNLMVKEFDPDLTRAFYFNDLWIVLDLHKDTDTGEGDETIAEYSLTITAALIKKFLDRKKKVGFMVYGDHPYLFPPDIGILHEQKINQTLAALKPAGEVTIEKLLMTQEDRLAAGGAVIVITSADHTRLVPALRRLANRGSAVTAVLVDAVSFGGKVSATETSRALSSAGVNVYTIKQGMEIYKALDVRHLASPVQVTETVREP